MHVTSLWINKDKSLPLAPWILSDVEKRVVKSTLEAFQTPMGTMHSLKGCFTTEGDLSRLKTYN